MYYKTIADVISKFKNRFPELKKTVNRKKMCYFAIDGEHSVKCNLNYLVQFKYVSNNVSTYYINYDSRNDSVTFYRTDKSGSFFSNWQSAPIDKISYSNLRTIDSEESYFQQMTIQNLTGFEISDIISLIEMADYVVQKTKEHRDESST